MNPNAEDYRQSPVAKIESESADVPAETTPDATPSRTARERFGRFDILPDKVLKGFDKAFE